MRVFTYYLDFVQDALEVGEDVCGSIILHGERTVAIHVLRAKSGVLLRLSWPMLAALQAEAQNVRIWRNISVVIPLNPNQSATVRQREGATMSHASTPGTRTIYLRKPPDGRGVPQVAVEPVGAG